MPKTTSPLLRIVHDISRPQWMRIIERLKRSYGMSVAEIADALEMSYMGVKKHCVAMEKIGYLDTSKKQKEVGRPEKIYRLTDKSNELFAESGTDFGLTLLDSVAQLEPNGAERLMHSYFQNQTSQLLREVDGETLFERAPALAKARDKMGYFSNCIFSMTEGIHIEEFHNPLQHVFERFPSLERMEEQMFEKILEHPVKRTSDVRFGNCYYRFDILQS